jgi:hypothetical protein
VWKWRSTLRRMNLRILELEKSLEASVEHRAAERKGRIRAQQVEPPLPHSFLKKFSHLRCGLFGRYSFRLNATKSFLFQIFSYGNGR